LAKNIVTAPLPHFRFTPMADIDHRRIDVRFVPIVLKKSFWGDDQNFSGPLMPFARGDMRDHIVSHKNDHGVSYGRYAVLQWWSRLKIGFCEILGVVQFSTFATLSTLSRYPVGPKKARSVFSTAGLLMGRLAPAASSDALPSVFGHLATPST
jgi:hypothetical protein